MAYFKIGDVDFSSKVSALKVTKSHNYNAQTNAAGDTVVDYINRKREFEVEIIALNDADMRQLMTAIDAFSVTISYREPQTGALVTGVTCIIPENEIEYYTIQTDKVMYQKTKLKITEL